MNNNENYQKNLTPLLSWFVLFIVGMNAIPVLLKSLPAVTAEMQAKLSILLMYIAIMLFCFMVKRMQLVYYVPGGPSYEQAKEGGEEARKLYASKVFDLFRKAMILTIVFMALSAVLKLSGFYDWIVATLCFITAAIGTTKVKFQDCVKEAEGKAEQEEESLEK